MANNFYTKTSNPQPNSTGSSALIRAEFSTIEAAFDKLPVMTGNGNKLVQVNSGGILLEATSAPTLGTPVSGDAANLTNTIAPQTHAAISKATPVDLDEIPITDSVAAYGLKKLTWANLKATVKTYFDALYQSTLVSGTNIKTVNGSTILGTGDLTISTGIGSIKTINSNSLVGVGNVVVQDTLVSGSNIKTINGSTILGVGDLAISTGIGTIKTVNSNSLVGVGNVVVQDVLVSGTTLKTVGGTTLLGAGDIPVQPTLVSGTNIKTVGGASLLGEGDVSVGALPVFTVILTTQAAVAGNHYILTNVAATTVTLPAAPASGDTVWITPDNGLTTNVVNFNGKDHQNVTWATDPTMTLDNSQPTYAFRFANNKWRFV